VATLTTQTITRAGLNPSYVAATSGGDKIKPGDRTWLHVKNGSGGSITVTLVTPGAVEGQAIADLAVAVPASGERMIGPIDDRLFRDPADGLCSITYSAVTSLTVAAIRI
jgi:hypothetical protein